MPATSSRRRHANRRNARRSTGPRTQNGKARSAQNGLRHGLRSDRAFLPGENRDYYLLLARALQERFQPGSPLEVGLFRRIVDAVWMGLRCFLLGRGLACLLHADPAASLEAARRASPSGCLGDLIPRRRDGLRYMARVTRRLADDLARYHALQRARRAHARRNPAMASLVPPAAPPASSASRVPADPGFGTPAPLSPRISTTLPPSPTPSPVASVVPGLSPGVDSSPAPDHVPAPDQAPHAADARMASLVQPCPSTSNPTPLPDPAPRSAHLRMGSLVPPGRPRPSAPDGFYTYFAGELLHDTFFYVALFLYPGAPECFPEITPDVLAEYLPIWGHLYPPDHIERLASFVPNPAHSDPIPDPPSAAPDRNDPAGETPLASLVPAPVPPVG